MLSTLFFKVSAGIVSDQCLDLLLMAAIWLETVIAKRECRVG
jgi:hypothetical protein